MDGHTNASIGGRKVGGRPPCASLPEPPPPCNPSRRDSVLPPEVEARVSIEAGATFGWFKYVGAKGVSLGVDHFGASAPAPILYEKYGLTPDNVVATAKSLLKK